MKITIMLIVAIACPIAARGQSFLNLDFESAYNLPGNPPFPNGVIVGVTNGLPGWTGHDGGNVLYDINYVSNNISGVSTAVVLEGGSLALNGNFSVGLYDGSISQTALVPANAKSLEFEAIQGDDLSVTLGGQKLLFQPISAGTGYTLYGANVPSNLNGQMETLSFGTLGVGQSLLDNIEFSPTGVPEPAELALIGVGVVLFGVWWRLLTAPSFVETSTEGRKNA